MKLKCLWVDGQRVEIRPAPRRRDWMDATQQGLPYRCIPLSVANVHGWELLCPYSFEVEWTGGPAAADLRIRRQPAPEASGVAPGAAADEPRAFLDSHFGNGILTFNPMVILCTEPGYNLWLSGPSNHFKDGIAAMTALIETDWLPYTFSMNWKVTRPNTVIRFEKDEPFGFFFPVPRGVVAACEPSMADMSSEPAIAENYRWALARRGLDIALADREQGQFQSWYSRGEFPKRASGSAPQHENTIIAKPFVPAKPAPSSDQ